MTRPLSASDTFPASTAPSVPRRGRVRRATATAAGSLAATIVSLLLAAAAHANTTSYAYSPGYQSFTVPTGVTSLHVEVDGGSGADGQGSYGGGPGAQGAKVVGDLNVTPGQALTLWVGGAGQSGGGSGNGNPSHNDFQGGSGGSGNGTLFGAGNGGGGGAASYIAEGAPVVLAGGGGGGGGSGTYVPASSSSGGGGSYGGYSVVEEHSAGYLYANTNPAGDANGAPAALGGAIDGSGSDNGGNGGGASSAFGGGGGGGGGGYATSDPNYGGRFSAGGGGGGGSNSFGGAGGAGGNSYAGPLVSNVSFDHSGLGAGASGQITLSYANPTTVSLYSSADSSNPGQPVTFRAFVSPSDGGGTVSFTSDGKTISACNKLAFVSGAGTDWEVGCTTSSLPPGKHTIAATYSGDAGYAASSASTAETVHQPTSSRVWASPATTGVNKAVTLTTSVSHSDGGGTVTLTENGAALPGCANLPLVAAGGYRAVCKNGWTQPGSNTIVASYTGDAADLGSSATTTVTVAAAPSVSSVSPKAGPTAGGQTVTVMGTSLEAAKVTIAGTPATNVKVLSDTQLTATVPAHSAGTAHVRVTTPGGISAVSSGDAYTYEPAPTVSAISPASGATGKVITVTGTGIVPGVTVGFGATPAAKVTRVSATKLQATVPAGSGTVPVTITTPGGTSTTSPADEFTYTTN